MDLTFTEEQIIMQVNKIEFEEDDVTFFVKTVSGEGKQWTLRGTAIVDGENYEDFVVEIETETEAKTPTAFEIMNIDWVWYDFVF